MIISQDKALKGEIIASNCIYAVLRTLLLMEISFTMFDLINIPTPQSLMDKLTNLVAWLLSRAFRCLLQNLLEFGS